VAGICDQCLCFCAVFDAVGTDGDGDFPVYQAPLSDFDRPLYDFHGDELKAIIYQVLGSKEDTGIDIMDIAEQHGIPTVFSKKAMKQARYTHEPRKNCDALERVDLRREQIFTIDGIYSKDFDDAVSLKMDGSDYILGVHIADVGYYIKEGSPLDLEARKRGMTAYLLSSVFPMFPKIISNGVCSLNENVDRYTLSVEMRISKMGIVKEITCFPAVICSKKRMTYEDVNLLLDGNELFGYENFKSTSDYEGPFQTRSVSWRHAKVGYAYSDTGFAITVGATTSGGFHVSVGKTYYEQIA